MTKTELTNAIAAAKVAYEDECKKLYVQFAKENNPVNIGDVVADTTKRFILKVERIEFYSTISGMQCNYTGIRLKQDGTPFKDQRKITMLQCNVGFINDQPYVFNSK